MICQSRCHRRSTLLPRSTMDWRRPGHSQRLMRTYKIAHSVFQRQVALQVVDLFRLRQCFTCQAAIALARGQIIPFNIRSVDLSIAQNLCDDFRCTKNDAPPDCNDPSPGTMFVELGITQGRLQHPTWLFGWSTARPASMERCRRTVIGNECFDIRWPLVTCKQGRLTISAGLKGC